MECRVITDQESAVGFRLAGVETFVARGDAEAEEEVCRILAQDRCGLLLINEQMLARLPEYLHRRFERAGLPLVVPVPFSEGWRQQEQGTDYLMRLIRRAIGYQMKLKR